MELVSVRGIRGSNRILSNRTVVRTCAEHTNTTGSKGRGFALLEFYLNDTAVPDLHVSRLQPQLVTSERVIRLRNTALGNPACLNISLKCTEGKTMTSRQKWVFGIVTVLSVLCLCLVAFILWFFFYGVRNLPDF